MKTEDAVILVIFFLHVRLFIVVILVCRVVMSNVLCSHNIIIMS